MLRVLADHHHMTVTLDDLALFADLFYGRLNFHSIIPPFFLFVPRPGQNAERAVRKNESRPSAVLDRARQTELSVRLVRVCRRSGATGNAKPSTPAGKPASPPSNSLSIHTALDTESRAQHSAARTLWKIRIQYPRQDKHTTSAVQSLRKSLTGCDRHAAISLLFSR